MPSQHIIHGLLQRIELIKTAVSRWLSTSKERNACDFNRTVRQEVTIKEGDYLFVHLPPQIFNCSRCDPWSGESPIKRIFKTKIWSIHSSQLLIAYCNIGDGLHTKQSFHQMHYAVTLTMQVTGNHLKGAKKRHNYRGNDSNKTLLTGRRQSQKMIPPYQNRPQYFAMCIT